MKKIYYFSLKVLVTLLFTSFYLISSAQTNGDFLNSGQSLGTNDSEVVKLADFNNDGILDAFVANTSGQGNTVWFGNGDGTFTDSGQTLGSSNSRGLGLGDFDGDGDIDVFVTNATSQANICWLNDGTGNFSNGWTQSANLSSSRDAFVS